MKGETAPTNQKGANMQTLFKRVQVFVLVILMSLSTIPAVHAKEKVPTIAELTTTKDSSKIDHYWLAMNMYYEAGHEPLIGKIAVGVVTLNRVRDSRFPKSVKAVVTEPNQFSWYNGQVKAPTNMKIWKECYEAARLLLTNRVGNDIISLLEGATYFHATYVSPSWKNKKTKVVQIGDHIFYKP